MSDYCDKRLFVFSFDYEFDTHVSLYKGHTAVAVSTERVLEDSQGQRGNFSLQSLFAKGNLMPVHCNIFIYFY